MNTFLKPPFTCNTIKKGKIIHPIKISVILSQCFIFCQTACVVVFTWVYALSGASCRSLIEVASAENEKDGEVLNCDCLCGNKKSGTHSNVFLTALHLIS